MSRPLTPLENSTGRDGGGGVGDGGGGATLSADILAGAPEVVITQRRASMAAPARVRAGNPVLSPLFLSPRCSLLFSVAGAPQIGRAHV